MNEVKEKAITEKVWFKRLSTIGIIIFSLGIPTYPVVYLIFDAGDSPATGIVAITFFIPSVISSLILFFVILSFFDRLPPMGKKIALPLIWITGLPGFIAFVIWSFLLFVIWFAGLPSFIVFVPWFIILFIILSLLWLKL